MTANTMTKSIAQLSHLTADFEWIDPARAQQLLAMNTRNRKISPAKVNILATKMTAGQWKVTGQAHVIVGKNGVLLNGQHTLSAVVKSGAAIRTLVVTGVDPEAWDAIDIGQKRTAAQMFDVAGTENGKALSAIIRRVDVIASLERTEFGWSSKRTGLDIDEIRAIYEADPAAWGQLASDAMFAVGRARHSGLVMPVSGVGALLHLTDQLGVDPAVSRAFTTSVVSLEGHVPNAPHTTMRRFLMNSLQIRGGDTGLTESSAWHKAWNAHVKGQQLAKMYPWTRATTTPYPMPIAT